MTLFTSKIFRKMLILMVMVIGTVAVTNMDRVSAKGGACCFSYCNPIYAICNTYTIPNDKYATLWDCIVEHYGADCEACNPSC
jgi:hypothetical protein